MPPEADVAHLQGDRRVGMHGDIGYAFVAPTHQPRPVMTPASPRSPSALVQIVRHAVNRRVLGFALRVALVVGLVLNLINQGEHVWAGSAVSWLHLVLNFVVPFCVSAFSGGRNEWMNHKAGLVGGTPTR